MNRNMYYIRPLKPNEIYHYGVKERSGRYPWGSGDRPKQRLEKSPGILGDEINRERKSRRKIFKGESEERAAKNYEIGKNRLENRKKVANLAADRSSRKIGWINTKRAGQEHARAENIKKVTNEILSDEAKVRILGDHTRKVRNVVIGTGSITTAGSFATSAAWLASVGAPMSALITIPTGLAIAIGSAWHNYYEKTKY